MQRTWRIRLAVGVCLLSGCTSSSPADTQRANSIAPSVTEAVKTPSVPASTTASPPSAPVPARTTASPPPTTSRPPTASPGPTSTGPGPNTTVAEVRTIATTVQGRPITALHRGAPGGHVVLVIGVIHGDEQAGLAITSRLAAMALPEDVDLWIVDSMNPDGQAAADRHNADQVDLNRNFPYHWGPIGTPGDPEYAGTGPASEPETRAIVSLITEIRPEMVIWYHQDLDRIAPSTGRDGRIRARYAELTGVPMLNITGGRYTGVAATWARHELDGSVAFIVELGPTIDNTQADTHAAAVLTVATELSKP
jgi:murein peptide amidase A